MRKPVVRKAWAPAVIGIGGLLLLPTFLDAVAPPPIEEPAISPLVLDREGKWLHAFTTPEGRWRFNADLDDIDPVFIDRLIAIEDKRFWKHGGVDPLAVARAGWDALTTGRVTSGASTITMQTARLLEPRPRTVSSKLIEMMRAAQIERRLSKRQILELYLTLAPYGGNLEGVRAASLAYFGKEPSALTDAEQALLIALPQAPEARRPDLKGEAARKARGEILVKLSASGLLARPLAAEADEARLPEARQIFPRAAYHSASELAARGLKENAPVIRSTLDLSLQKSAELIVANAAASNNDGATAAAIIIDARTREVRAAVGSSGLSAEGGWIDLTNVLRSPGSTLKPFIYALAFDDGLVGPATVIEDMPQSFDGYAPENFDRIFRGDVHVADALQHSLNVPAVKLLDRLGAPRLESLLKAAGVSVRTPKRADARPGLTLALGGAGVTMRDLGVLYAGLADGGLILPLRWTTDERASSDDAAFHLISSQSAAMVSAILADAPALEGRAPATLSASAPKIAMKTGTSYGYRDAWAAGHAGGYVVVAWVGRADGASRPGATGREAAAPLLVSLFDMIWRFDPNAAAGVRANDLSGGAAIAQFSPPKRTIPPEITFPRDGVELYADASANDGRGFSLAARGGAGGYRWYVGGAPAPVEPGSGRAVWRPEAPGFYDVVVVDAEGRSAQAKVRVAMGG
ncbi:MAG: penicillin-binding protein 1C [Pseudomonadota bacterium]|nr:penicillin-binding protein 1C [Pseudomonadota bacterium]